MRRQLAGVAIGAFMICLISEPAVGDDLVLELPDGPIALERLVPGSMSTTPVVIHNRSPHDSQLEFAVLDLEERENGCLRPESRSGDQSCATQEGELGQWLMVTLAHADSTLWRGRLSDLREVAEITGMSGGESWNLDITVALPRAAGNETMTDAVNFKIRVSVTADTGETQSEILGVDAIASGPSGVAGSGVTLPLTGAAASPALLAAVAALLMSGGLMLGRVGRGHGSPVGPPVLSPVLRRRSDLS